MVRIDGIAEIPSSNNMNDTTWLEPMKLTQGS